MQSVAAGQAVLILLLAAFCLVVLALATATAWVLRKIPVLRKFVKILTTLYGVGGAISLRAWAPFAGEEVLNMPSVVLLQAVILPGIVLALAATLHGCCDRC